MCVLVISLIHGNMVTEAESEIRTAENLTGRVYIMGKKIVVITGSPRKNGNSFAMTEAFIKAAEKKGHTITRFDAALKNVGGCHEIGRASCRERV